MKKAGKKEIINLLVDMFVLPQSCLDGLDRSSVRLSGSFTPQQSTRVVSSLRPSALDDDDSDESMVVENSNATAVASLSLGVTNKRSLLEKGEYLEAGSLQIAAAIARQGGDRIKANAAIEKLGGIPRSAKDFDAIKSIGASRLGPILDRIDNLQKKELMDKIPLGLFKIGADEYLLSWLVSGTRWNEGERLPRKMSRLSQENSQPMLSEESAHIIRHILFEYKIPLSKFGGLLNMFAILLLGRELDDKEFSSASTIRTWMDRLAVIDRHYQ